MCEGPCTCGGLEALSGPRRRRPVHLYLDFLPPAAETREAELITSQWFINPHWVQDKLEANDFEVMVSPLFHVDGQPLRVIMDGHHSYRASLIANAQPVLVESEPWHGINRLLAAGDVLGALRHQFQKMGPYYYARTRQLVWQPGSPYFMEA